MEVVESIREVLGAAEAVRSDVIGGVANDGTEARARVVNIEDEEADMDCCIAASDGRLRRASRFKERAVVDAMVAMFMPMLGFVLM